MASRLRSDVVEIAYAGLLDLLTNNGTKICPMNCVAWPLLHGLCYMEIAMNWSEVEANWKEVKGKAKQAWGHLTDDDLDKIAGKRDELEGRIQKQYGLSKDVAKRNVDEWMQKIRSDEPEPKVQHVGGTNTGMIVLGGIFSPAPHFSYNARASLS
jgi:uncharacterized protein YjbJ (UPF0337 family)